jgi:hypothetical protein
MTRFSTMCAVFALSVAGPMFAQDASSPPNQPMNQPTQPSAQTPMQSQPMNSPAQGSTTAADLTGQMIYSAKGTKLGTVSSMSTDAQGQQAAAVTMGKHLGMGGQTVLIPTSSLQARSNGGYTTTLSTTELKALSKAGGAQ